MMARSKSSNQRPDTLMQDRNRQLDENLLQRAAGPYIWVKGRSGRQADGTAGLPPASEMRVCFGTYASCHKRTFSGVAAYFGKLTIILLTTGFVARNPAPLESNDRSGITSFSSAWVGASGWRSSIPTKTPSTQPPDNGALKRPPSQSVIAPP